MGLDITAVKNARLVGKMPVEKFEEKLFPGCRLIYVYADYVNDGFMAAKDLSPDSVYEYEDSFEFRAGSYGGYNDWREALSMFAYNVPPSVVWKNNDAYKDKPFYRLINFSDCEGIIGPEECKKLDKNFRDYQEAFSNSSANEWHKEKYNEWLKAFGLAADNGFVEFH